MCKLCELELFAIETINMLAPDDVIKSSALEAATEQGTLDEEFIAILEHGMTSKMNFIAGLVSLWCYKEKMPFEQAMSFIHQYMYHCYFVRDHDKHKEKIAERLRDYGS